MTRHPLSAAKSAFGSLPVMATIRLNVVWLGMALIGILSAPGSNSGWSMVWLIVATLLVSVALIGVNLARAIDGPRAALVPIAIAASSAIAACIISLILRPLSELFLIIALTLLLFAGKNRPFVSAALAVIVAPWWIWLALDDWHWHLLMLVPLVGLGLVAVSHLLDSHVWPADTERIMPARAHRWAAWLLIALSGIVLMAAGLMSDVSRPLLALAGIVLAASIPMEAGFGSISGATARQSVRVVVSAYLIAITCWLIGVA